jgi:hypothetical protein
MAEISSRLDLTFGAALRPFPGVIDDRNPSSTARGRFVCVIGAWPNCGDAGFVFGNPKIGVMVALNAETRNLNCCCSVMRKTRVTVASNWGGGKASNGGTIERSRAKGLRRLCHPQLRGRVEPMRQALAALASGSVGLR